VLWAADGSERLHIPVAMLAAVAMSLR
jgi:hypothetical protein